MQGDQQSDSLNLEQLRKYARDLSIVYKAERDKTLELEHLAAKLKAEIAGRTQAETALAEREGLFRGIFESAVIGIGVTDTGGRLEQVNESLASILQVTVGDKITRVFSREDRIEIDNTLSQLFNGNLLRLGFEKSITIAGRLKHLRFDLNAIGSGVEARLILLIEDITDRKKAELEIQNLSDLLIQIQEDERSRISQELHDDLGSDLFGLKLQIESAVSRFFPDFKSDTKYHELMTHLMIS